MTGKLAISTIKFQMFIFLLLKYNTDELSIKTNDFQKIKEESNNI